MRELQLVSIGTLTIMNKKELKETIKELKENYPDGAIDAYIRLFEEESIDSFEGFYQGEYSNDEDFVRDLLEGNGDISRDLPSYIHIDWEATARDIMMDYSEDNGFYFRN